MNATSNTVCALFVFLVWFAVHPGDAQGALDFAGGHKQMAASDIIKSAHQMAAADFKNYLASLDQGRGKAPDNFDPGAWLENRRQQYEQALRGGAGGGAAAANDLLGIR